MQINTVENLIHPEDQAVFGTPVGQTTPPPENQPAVKALFKDINQAHQNGGKVIVSRILCLPAGHEVYLTVHNTIAKPSFRYHIIKNRKKYVGYLDKIPNTPVFSPIDSAIKYTFSRLGFLLTEFDHYIESGHRNETISSTGIRLSLTQSIHRVNLAREVIYLLYRPGYKQGISGYTFCD